MRIRVVHGRTPVHDSDDLLDTGNWEPSGLDENDGPTAGRGDRVLPPIPEPVAHHGRLAGLARRLATGPAHAHGNPDLSRRLARRHSHPRRGQPAPESVPQAVPTGDRPSLAHIWKREFQERGAPHLHLYGWWPRRVGDLYLIAWVSHTWYEVVGTGLREHLNAGTRVDYRQSFDMSNPLRVAFYFSGYASSKGSKEYRNEAPKAGSRTTAPSAATGAGSASIPSWPRSLSPEPTPSPSNASSGACFAASTTPPIAGPGPDGPATHAPVTGPTECANGGSTHATASPTLKGTDSGFSYLTADGARLAFDVARTLALADPPPSPKGQPRPLP